MRNNVTAADYFEPNLLFPTFSAFLDNFLPLGVDLFVINLTGSFTTLLSLGCLRLDTDSRGTAAPDLFFGIFPRGGTIVNLVPGGYKSIIVHSNSSS